LTARRETCAWVGGVYVCWEEVENIPGVRDPNTVCNSTVWTIAAPPNYLSDDPSRLEPSSLFVETLREQNASTFEYTGGWTFFDGLARTLQIQTIDTNTTDDRVLTTTQYDAAGRVAKQSAPTHDVRLLVMGSRRWFCGSGCRVVEVELQDVYYFARCRSDG